MDIGAYINSGIIEKYCMGTCSAREREELERLAAAEPRIREEINAVQASIEQYLLANQVKPTPSVKIKLMQEIYRQIAMANPIYPPLIRGEASIDELRSWIKSNALPELPADLENLAPTAIPSTGEIENFFVFARKGHEPELHDHFIEYLYVIKGSCTMYFNEKPVRFAAGQLISIMPGISHYAVVDSEEPMLAMVQRQQCA